MAEAQNLNGKWGEVKQNTEAVAEIQTQFNREAVLLDNLKHSALSSVTDDFIEPDGYQLWSWSTSKAKIYGKSCRSMENSA